MRFMYGKIRKNGFKNLGLALMALLSLVFNDYFYFLGDDLRTLGSLVVLMLGVLLVFLRSWRPIDKSVVICYSLMVSVLLAYALFSSHMSLALYKVVNIAFVPLLSGVFLSMLYIRDPELKGLVFALFVFLIAAVISNYGAGLGVRSTRYFLNGPIVFSWLMGMGLVISVLAYLSSKHVHYLIYAIVFFMAILWTHSKGPIIAVALAFLIRWRIRFLGWVFLLVLVGCFVGWLVGVDFAVLENTRVSAMFRFLTGKLNEADYGSIGIRGYMWFESVSMFFDNPFFGVGLAGWQDFTSTHLVYPHNFILEIFSEMGLLVGISFMAMLVVLYKRINSVLLKMLFTYMFLCLMFSGDISYVRYLLVLPVAYYFSKKKDVLRIRA